MLRWRLMLFHEFLTKGYAICPVTCHRDEYTSCPNGYKRDAKTALSAKAIDYAMACIVFGCARKPFFKACFEGYLKKKSMFIKFLYACSIWSCYLCNYRLR